MPTTNRASASPFAPGCDPARYEAPHSQPALARFSAQRRGLVAYSLTGLDSLVLLYAAQPDTLPVRSAAAMAGGFTWLLAAQVLACLLIAAIALTVLYRGRYE